ncbi:MAG: MmgE/PrpD family protein [Rhodospirillales bacterium]|jgi:2-methylcitrate dehydratase|nr:MmgE/PrpD family protein [Rhodospirillales bacterium]
MDDITRAIAGFAAGVEPGNISPAARQAMVDHIVDAYGCALAGIDEEPSRIARAMAPEAHPGASIIGMANPAPPAQAAFANGVMIRCLDFNDTFNSRTGGHPTDMLAGIMVTAEMAGLPGSAVIDGLFAAYEVFGALADAMPLRGLGVDQGAFISVAAAAGIAACLGLDEVRAGQAISLAITSAVPLRVAHAGDLSPWKGCAIPHAVMNAVLVSDMAARGMTGPGQPFRGIDGFLELVGVDLELGEIGCLVEGRSVVERTGLKFRPVEWCAQAPVELFVRLAAEGLKPGGIAAIDIEGCGFMVNEIGGGRGDGAAKWDPQTRETADHSLAYLIAVAITDGEVTLDSFHPERFSDPALRPLMQKISVSEDPESSAIFPARQPVRITITLKDGQVLEEGCEFAAGHPMNTAGPEAIDAKFKNWRADVWATGGV